MHTVDSGCDFLKFFNILVVERLKPRHAISHDQGLGGRGLEDRRRHRSAGVSGLGLRFTLLRKLSIVYRC